MLLLFCSAAPVFAIKTEADIFPFNGEDTFFSIQGATLIGDGQYSFTEEALFSIDQPVTGDWNQYKLTYSSTQPLSGVIQYQADGQEKEEIFYLEAGENKTFSSYIDGYLESKTAQQLLSLSFTSIKGEEADFTFLSLDTQKETVYEDEVLYLENQRFKVGVNLQWGGGLSYFEDKQCAVEGLENMLNHHDTGRLVQQSYYGISSAPYENGNYNGAVWPYNPVQGGDLYGNASKIVEIRVTENQIYIKSLPLDWAKDNVPTQCYMENTYTLEENQLRVDNRFVDFSNYIHPRLSRSSLLSMW